ncbi:MAG: SusC/RagA family TonB-linked outer membrane protein [Bacteroidota bacterium]|nr:SusC/RagA family TonB-linked outer membrane protein [Bacteroidota bacterium]
MRKFLTIFPMLMLLSIMAFSQSRDITGSITDEKGNAIPFATIKAKGGGSTTASDDGKFVLKSLRDEVTLEVSSIGYLTQTVKVRANNPVTIALKADAKSLENIVVTGVGVATDKRKVAISVQSISSDKLPPTPSASIDQALIGKVAGATISSASGNPGAEVSILLRGINTVQGGTSPLIMIDGVEMGALALQSLDLNTIDHVEIAQGAASATIYGAQGANGVIQIFTKRGKLGATRIDVSSRISFDEPLNLGNFHQPYKHSFITDANGIILDNNGDPLAHDSLGIWGETTWLNTGFAANNKPYLGNVHYYDHIKQLFHNAQTINNSITLSGAREKFDYALSASNSSQESIIQGTLKRSNLTSNIGFEIAKNFKLRFVNQFILKTSDLGNAPISSAVYTYPFADFTYKDPDGNSTLKFGGAGANASNPYYYFQFQRYKDIGTEVAPSINLNYKLPRFFELDYKYGLSLSRSDYQNYARNQENDKSSVANNAFVGQSLAGSIAKNLSRDFYQNSLATITARVDFQKDLHLNVPITSTSQVAYDWRKRYYYRLDANFVGLPKYEPVNGSQATVNNANEYEYEFTTYGYYVTERLDFSDIGGISGGFRNDKTSILGRDYKQQFPRGDAYLRVSKLGFWNSLQNIFPEFKLRAAYGEAGIQPGVFDKLITLRKGSFDNASWLAAKSVAANPALQIEVSKELELGTDLEFNLGNGNWFKGNKFSGTYWKRSTANAIYTQDDPQSTGISSTRSNSFDLNSHGWQFLLDANVYSSKNFNWNFVTTFGKEISTINKIRNGQDILLPFGSINYVLKEGQRLGTVYGYKAITSFDMVDPSGALYIAKADQGNYEIVNGIVTDTATKRVQFTSDKYAIGNTDPKFTLSFTNTFSYKDYVVLSFQWDWFYGSKRYNQTKEWAYSEGLDGDYDNPVTINGVTLPFSAFYKSYYDAVESNGTKDFFFENASFFRLRNISLAFDAAKFLKFKGVNRLQLVLSGRNIVTFTKYRGFDPEATSDGTANNSIQRGADQFAFPNLKSYQVGLNLGF